MLKLHNIFGGLTHFCSFDSSVIYKKAEHRTNIFLYNNLYGLNQEGMHYDNLKYEFFCDYIVVTMYSGRLYSRVVMEHHHFDAWLKENGYFSCSYMALEGEVEIKEYEIDYSIFIESADNDTMSRALSSYMDFLYPEKRQVNWN